MSNTFRNITGNNNLDIVVNASAYPFADTSWGTYNVSGYMGQLNQSLTNKLLIIPISELQIGDIFNSFTFNGYTYNLNTSTGESTLSAVLYNNITPDTPVVVTMDPVTLSAGGQQTTPIDASNTLTQLAITLTALSEISLVEPTAVDNDMMDTTGYFVLTDTEGQTTALWYGFDEPATGCDRSIPINANGGDSKSVVTNLIITALAGDPIFSAASSGSGFSPPNVAITCIATGETAAISSGTSPWNTSTLQEGRAFSFTPAPTVAATDGFYLLVTGTTNSTSSIFINNLVINVTRD